MQGDKGAVYGLDGSIQRFQCEHLRPITPIPNFFLTGSDIGTCGLTGGMLAGFMTAYMIEPRVKGIQTSEGQRILPSLSLFGGVKASEPPPKFETDYSEDEDNQLEDKIRELEYDQKELETKHAKLSQDLKDQKKARRTGDP